MNFAESLFYFFYILALLIYGFAMSFIFAYGIIQLQLFWSYLKRKSSPVELKEFTPKISIQLPVFNEGLIASRLIDAVCMLNYPKELLDIQVLDDSTDDSLKATNERVSFWKNSGIHITHIHREVRSGFKAGALKEGLVQCKGDFVAIFDADFIPEPDFLKKCISQFLDENIAVVQTRWDHINRNESLLTQVQALALDMHFSIEQGGREALGVFLNFNGTAGIWRKSAILDAGNWEADTLTEDLDLSYRAQMKGWKIRYLEDVASPAELPAFIGAIKSQQHRWNKGGAQVAKKHLLKILSGSLSWKVKIHACFHLLNSSVFVALLISAVASIFISPGLQRWPLATPFYFLSWIFLLALFALAMNFFMAYRKFSGKPIFFFPFFFFAFLIIAMGVSIHNARAVIGGLSGKRSDFIRTPKMGDKSNISHAFHYLQQQNKDQFMLETVAGILFLLVFAYDLFNGWYAPAYYHGMLFLGYSVIAFTGRKHSLKLKMTLVNSKTNQPIHISEK
jgi:cellulose synthase/poly-beta-1,6-N-acetylglucosamine synthase-like glycosyltransferase